MKEQRACPHECAGRCGEDLHVDAFLEPSGFLEHHQRELINHYAAAYIAEGWHVIAVEAALWLAPTTDTDAVAVIFVEATSRPFTHGLFN